jgi:oxalate decarboxylase/phosphoglucose isomerase-like protein (cupin superfamily)
MRKIIVLTTFLIIAFAVGVKAQSTWNNPWPGATHHYVATVTDPGNDNPVRWWVATNASGNTKAVYSTDYTFVTTGYNAGNDQLEGTAVYDVQITWGASDAGNTNYYVVMEVDDGTTGCTNRMTLHVQINAAFNALVTDNISDPSCPGDIVNPLWDGDSHTDIGNSELVFRIEKHNTVLNWQFEFDITEGSTQPFLIDSIRFVDDLSNTVAITNPTGDKTGGEVHVNSSENYVLAHVFIRNQMGVTLHMNFELITVNSLTKDAGNNLDAIATDNSVDHTIQAMPVITNFTGN